MDSHTILVPLHAYSSLIPLATVFSVGIKQGGQLRRIQARRVDCGAVLEIQPLEQGMGAMRKQGGQGLPIVLCVS